MFGVIAISIVVHIERGDLDYRSTAQFIEAGRSEI
jgi:hypothetical protein